MERGEEVKCTNTTLHSTNCIESFTAEGILPRRDELKFEQRTVFFFKAREGTGKRSAQIRSFKVELHRDIHCRKILPRRDNSFGLSKGLVLLSEKKGAKK